MDGSENRGTPETPPTWEIVPPDWHLYGLTADGCLASEDNHGDAE